MHRSPSLYSAFALAIRSEVPLIELPPGEGTADVYVVIDAVPDVAPSRDWTVIATPGDVRGWIPSGGAFHVVDGTRITVDPAADADERALRLGIVGPLLGVILTQRGRFVLHASTVAIDGRAVAFYGPSGRGKSTITAALDRAGHPLIADDMTVIDSRPDGHVVHPGFPRVKLWPDSAAAVGQDVDALPLLHPERTKRSLQLQSVHREPLPLARCYLLEDGPEESSSAMGASEAVLSLIGTTYQAQWLHLTGASGPNLAHCAALARTGMVRRLRRRRSYDALPDVIRFIENDVLR